MKSIKTILITGASSGIGAALAQAYANKNRQLYLIGRDAERLENVAQKCREMSAIVEAKLIDVRDQDAMSSWILSCDDKAPLDLVIANAGVSNAGETVLYETNQMLFDINLQGVLNTIHPILPRMQARRSGQLVLMSSLAGYRALARAPAYGASKAAVKAYGEALGGLLAEDNVTVTVLCPGFIKTPLTDKNKFFMPCLMSLDDAVKRIVKGIQKKKLLVAFPWPLHALVWLLSVLPASVASRLTKRL
ncbi:MAG: SDR family NAD(P)-dependent oxidoreductase [Coxiellaceae bacterium]|nr:SDR family NAD(P)-dependent oxidoreductase [Coxiellaceae bacterium]